MHRLWLATVAAFALTLPQPVTAQSNRSTVTAVARASVLKPLTLTGQQNLNFGTILLGRSNFGAAVVSISQTGARSCPVQLTCSGAVSAAAYRVSGTNNQIVTITAPPVVLVNVNNPAQTLMLRLDAPASVSLPNSGNQGVQFGVGGSLTVSSATPDGTYAGTLEVTVNYN